MILIDLVTGFLGAGKTTFIKEYTKHLVKRHEKVCILENDYGAINVDTMLLSDLLDQQVGIEMVVGGNDYDCHKRRFKTKLIMIAMLGYTRVVVEPSGVFDVDEFFDLLQEEPLCDLYQIHNVFTLIDVNVSDALSNQAKYMLASQLACTGKLVFSHIQDTNEKSIYDTLMRVNQALKDINCHRQFIWNQEVFTQNWLPMSDEAFEQLDKSGYREYGYVKKYGMEEMSFGTLFFMHVQLEESQWYDVLHQVLEDHTVGNIERIKGFFESVDGWMEINATRNNIQIRPCANGQNVIIVIGEDLQETALSTFFPCRYSSTKTQ